MGDSGPRTLAIDVGGTGLKAVVLDPDGEMISERLRVETPYPCPPPVLLDELDKLAKAQPEYDRVSVGFPGAIRRGRVREVPAFSRRGPGLWPGRRCHGDASHADSAQASRPCLRDLDHRRRDPAGLRHPAEALIRPGTLEL